MADLKCVVVTPEETVVDQPADFVAVTLYDGEIGIAPGHTPLIGRLGNGELRITRADRILRYYVEGGFVEVIDNVVSVLTQRAVAAREIDEAAARMQLTTATATLAVTPDQVTARDRAMSQARAQLLVARHERE